MKRLGFVVMAALALLQGGRVSAEPGDRYFVDLYSYENWRNAAAFSHTFAAFYRFEAKTGQITRVNISWIPQDGYMRGLRPLRMPAFGDVPGQNLSIEDTLNRAYAAGRLVQRFGPYESRPELFNRAMAQVQNLHSGAVSYRGLDMATRPYSVNCVHAVTSMVGEFYTGLSRGPGASAGVVQFFAQHGMLTDMRVQADWVPFLDGRAVALPAGLPMIRIY